MQKPIFLAYTVLCTCSILFSSFHSVAFDTLRLWVKSFHKNKIFVLFFSSSTILLNEMECFLPALLSYQLTKCISSSFYHFFATLFYFLSFQFECIVKKERKISRRRAMNQREKGKKELFGFLCSVLCLSTKVKLLSCLLWLADYSYNITSIQ